MLEAATEAAERERTAGREKPRSAMDIPHAGPGAHADQGADALPDQGCRQAAGARLADVPSAEPSSRPAPTPSPASSEVRGSARMATSNAPSSSGVCRVVSAGEGRPGAWRRASALLTDDRAVPQPEVGADSVSKSAYLCVCKEQDPLHVQPAAGHCHGTPAGRAVLCCQHFMY